MKNVAGITWSDDKVLQSRVNAYQDTQRYRIGVQCALLFARSVQNGVSLQSHCQLGLPTRTRSTTA